MRKKISDGVYVTIACGWGKKGQITTGTNDYVACQASNGSNFATSNTDRLAGVPVKWSNLFNVHKCTSSSTTNNIPVIAAKLTTGEHAGISAANYTVSPNSDATKPAIFCLDITSKATIKSGLGITNNADDNKIDVLANCGLAALDLTADPNLNDTSFDNTGYSASNPGDYLKSTLACVACKPGYVSDFGTGTFKNLARKCTAIANCNQSVT